MGSKKAVTVGWFEIPVKKMKRATTFYEEVLKTELIEQNFGDTKMALFPMDDSAKGAGGSLINAGDFYTPSHDGSMVYFSCDNLADELSRVEKAGGTILRTKTQISPEYGYMAILEDTEGNRVALHSQK
jgi:predicted enzyme related to lactoylglutathione lyase